MRVAHRLVPGLLAGSLLLGGATGVFAAPAHAKAHFAVFGGQVTSISGSTLSVTLNPGAVARKGATPKTLQVTLSATVKERGLGGATGGPAVSDYAAFAGIKTATGFTANRVLYSTKARLIHRAVLRLRALHTLAALAIHRALGSVQSSTATTLTVTTRAGKTVTFQISSTTKYFVNGQLVTTAPTFSSGQIVFVRFKRDKTTKQLEALAIRTRS